MEVKLMKREIVTSILKARKGPMPVQSRRSSPCEPPPRYHPLLYSSQSTDLRLLLLPSLRVVVTYLVVHSTTPSRAARSNCAARGSAIVLAL
jgi:hypothetical protein